MHGSWKATFTGGGAGGSTCGDLGEGVIVRILHYEDAHRGDIPSTPSEGYQDVELNKDSARLELKGRR
ncbi:hypothetical protein FNV43_RR10325 [Rhamnella rubrinervis]|uniref:Uncharacterized protein n=1 Tax=Rhamnella rubrinervis TaxID=2594499 RepID=A0A8K0HBK9_9ROSA|nr:hypothetical protein FNV43_RR10325 [Rhamnella rubrinervis]